MKFLKFTEYQIETTFPVSRLVFVQISQKDPTTSSRHTTILFHFDHEEIGSWEIKSNRDFYEIARCRNYLLKCLADDTTNIIDVNWIFSHYTGVHND